MRVPVIMSLLVAAPGWAVPVQNPHTVIAVRLEEIGADGVTERGIVELQRDVLARLLAGALPAGSDLRSVIILA
jgi:hypothetical protein